MLRKVFSSVFSRENLLALGLALIAIALVTPQWIYQGF
jgi:hypothetical protein